MRINLERRVDHSSQRGLITEALINSLSNMKEIAQDVIDAGYIPDQEGTYC